MLSCASKGPKRPPRFLEIRSSAAFIVATVWTSSFTDYFLYAMIVPVMPTALVDRAEIPFAEREYWVSVLLMCEAAVAFLCCPIFGYLIDIAPSRQFPYLLGLILLGASMGLLAVAHTVWLFVTARLLQGGASAMVAVAGLALLTDSVAFDNLGQTIGYLGSSIALGFLLGPLLGGLVYDAAGYNAVFAMAFAIIAVDLIMRVAVIEKKVARAWTSEPEPGPSHPREQIPDESRGKHGLALLRIASQPRVLISCWALLVQGILYSAFDSTIPIFVETRFGWTPFGAGMAFLPSAFTALFEPYFGSISDRYGARPVTFACFLLLAPPLIALRLVTDNTTHDIILLLSLLTVIGLLINASLPALYVETQQVLDDMERARPGVFGPRGAVAQAFGIQTMAQFAGLFLGPLWGGFVEYRFGWGVMSATLGVLAAGTAVPMLWLGRGEGEGGGEGLEGEGVGERRRLLGEEGNV
ncbi:MFS transporter [Aspergillus clavatus NRRL 1]|uniref:MFS transporter, putative n=1 Tax=Aspergillus clavatus (strain ATCC 1007 / CBS 513.65 / DSM 816 / NCTC 3887 / NRRL 1 / QM 1276 / 107) TaxID=344612 RepID=A1C6A3_ASPCL|nr:MFS transporter, putative [Aspergillus clavatus NRRL 1]EAW13924.1 MFS transporter, putative [Aspergillus clavatus NRRL 1]